MNPGDTKTEAEPSPAGSLRRTLGPILLLALAVRLAALVCASDLPSFSHHRLDSLIYDTLGRTVAAGDLAAGAEVFHVSPGYTYFVGAAYAAFGTGPWGIRLAQTAVGLAAVAFVFLSARRLSGPRWAVVAGLAAALYGPFAFYEGQILSDTLLVAGQAAFLWILIRGIQADRPRAATWLLAGAVLGVCVDVRASALLLLPVALAAARRPRYMAAVVAGCAALVLPVSVRNYAVSGEPVLLTDNGGINFFIGNGPGANGTFRVPDEVPEAVSVPTQWAAYSEVARRATGRDLTAREVDAYWYDRTFESMVADPVAWMKVVGEKVWLFWNAREIPNNEDYGFNRLQNPVLGAPLVQFGWIAPLALLGTLVQLFSRRREEAVVAWSTLAMVLSLAAFFVVGRYRVAAVPGLLLSAVGMADRIVRIVRERAWPDLLAPTAILVLSAVVVFTPKLPKPFDDEWFKLGYAYHVQGRLGEAEAAYAHALDIAPENPSALKNLAVLNEETGHPDRAALLWQRLLAVATARSLPDYADTARRHLAAPAPGR